MRNYVELYAAIQKVPSSRTFIGRTEDEAQNIANVWQHDNGGTTEYLGKIYVRLNRENVFFLTGLSTFSNSAFAIGQLFDGLPWTAWNAGGGPNPYFNAGLTLNRIDILAIESPRRLWSRGH